MTACTKIGCEFRAVVDGLCRTHFRVTATSTKPVFLVASMTQPEPEPDKVKGASRARQHRHGVPWIRSRNSASIEKMREGLARTVRRYEGDDLERVRAEIVAPREKCTAVSASEPSKPSRRDGEGNVKLW